MYTGALLGYTINYGTLQFGENAEITACGGCANQLKYDYRIAMEVAIGFSAIIAWIVMAKCERIAAIRTFMILLSLCLTPFYWSIKGWALASAVGLISLLNSAMMIIVAIYDAELLPTCDRSLGMGIANSFHYFGTTCGGFLAAYVYHEHRYICFGIVQAVCVFAIIAAFCVRWETKDKALKDQ